MSSTNIHPRATGADVKKLLLLRDRLLEVVKLCRDVEWNVLNHEFVELLTDLEREALEVPT